MTIVTIFAGSAALVEVWAFKYFFQFTCRCLR